MKKITLLLLFNLNIFFGQPQIDWNVSEINQADTARDIENISEFEKDVILYHNLVRMFPKKYIQIELLNFKEDLETKDKLKFPYDWEPQNINSKYFKTLINTLQKQKPLPKLNFDKSLSSSAKCLAKEQSVNGKTGHRRVKCKDIAQDKTEDSLFRSSGIAENCGYGTYNGKDLVNQLLIDQDVPSLGHRNTILNPQYNKIGVGVDFHPKYEKVIVVDYSYINYFKN